MKTNYNYLALRGADTDDMEFVENFGLDPAVAYTKKINEAMLQKTHDSNIADGMEPKEADKLRLNAAKDINELLARKGLLK